MPRKYTEASVQVVDYTNPKYDSEIRKVYIISESKTYYGLLSFDYKLEAFEAATRLELPLEIRVSS